MPDPKDRPYYESAEAEALSIIVAEIAATLTPAQKQNIASAVKHAHHSASEPLATKIHEIGEQIIGQKIALN